MAETINIIVAFGVIFFVFKWVFSSPSPASQAEKEELEKKKKVLGFKPKDVSSEMVTTVSQMFPHIPAPNIHYDLLRHGSAESTTNRILEAGSLARPPAGYFRLYPQYANPNTTTTDSTARPAATGSSTATLHQSQNLLARYSVAETDATVGTDSTGGKSKWEDSAEKREESLKDRKARMILEARQNMIERMKAQEAKNMVRAA